MSDFWVDFKSGPSCYVCARTKEEASEKAASHGDVALVRDIPYPAMPQPFGGSDVGCPPFCYTPERCAGRTSCPKNPACSE